MITTVALNEPRKRGDVIELVGHLYRIEAEMSREEYVNDLQRRREADAKAGLPRARAGTYTSETKEFIPGREIPPDCKYFYRITLERAR